MTSRETSYGEWFPASGYVDEFLGIDDRDDTYDPEFRDPDGYCEHGRYVGGCGADLMCFDCEMGISAAERAEINRAEVRRKTQRRLKLRLALADAGYKLSDVMTPDHVKRSI
jgi:hypothetical protein